VWVSPEELAAIAASMQLSAAEFTNRHTRRVGKRRSLNEHSNGDCEFLRHEGGKRTCGIYAVRPLQCRTWPFWQSNLKSERSWQSAARGCPGMGRGAHHALPVIQAAVAKNAAADLPL
jgi:Fe-S-cluster containining protein